MIQLTLDDLHPHGWCFVLRASAGKAVLQVPGKHCPFDYANVVPVRNLYGQS